MEEKLYEYAKTLFSFFDGGSFCFRHDDDRAARRSRAVFTVDAESAQFMDGKPLSSSRRTNNTREKNARHPQSRRETPSPTLLSR